MELEEEFFIAIYCSKQSTCEEPHPQPGGAYGSPQVQSSFPIAGLGYSKGDLHFSNLRLVILIITKHVPFWGKVTPSCSVQQACWKFFGLVCCKPLAVSYLGYGLPTHPSVELRQWQKCHLAVAGLSSAAHTVIMHAEQCVFMALKRGPLFPATWHCFVCCFFPCAYGRRTCSAPGTKWLIAPTALDQLLVGFEQEPHHSCGEMSRLLPCCGRCCLLPACRGSGIAHWISCLFSVALADLWEQTTQGWGGRKDFLGKLPGHLFQLLRSWKSELGSNALLSRDVADFPAPVKISWNAIT